MMDDDAAIGGRTLSANLNDEEARLAKQRIYRLLDGFEEWVGKNDWVDDPHGLDWKTQLVLVRLQLWFIEIRHSPFNVFAN
jgi:hypothetical protein